MSKFEAKSFGERIRIIWKSLFSLKEIFYMSLVCFALIAGILIIVPLATDESGFSKDLGLHPLLAYLVFFVLIFIFVLFLLSLAYFCQSIRLAKKHTWQYLIIIPQRLTLRKSDGVETVINQSEILSIYLLEPKETKGLIEERFRPLWHDIKLDVLKIKLHREDYCIILDAYDDAKQILVELDNICTVDQIAE